MNSSSDVVCDSGTLDIRELIWNRQGERRRIPLYVVYQVIANACDAMLLYENGRLPEVPAEVYQIKWEQCIPLHVEARLNFAPQSGSGEGEGRGKNAPAD